jgi:hypothetical protein
VQLEDGESVRYTAAPPGGATGHYDLTVSSAGKLKGVSAAGLAVTGRLSLEEGTGTLRLADGQRLEFEVTEDVAADLAHLRRGQVLVVVLPDGRLRGAGIIRPAAGTGKTAFFIRSS